MRRDALPRAGWLSRVAMTRVLAVLLPACVLPGMLGVVSTARAALPYETEIRAFEAEDLRMPPPPDAVLFVGSSTITRWTDLKAAFPGHVVLNRGFGGSKFSDVLNHFDRVVRRYDPPLIVVYEGDNDLAGGRTPDQVFGDWTNFVGRVERELPSTGVVFLSVKPSPSRVGDLAAQRELNARVAADCGRRARCRYADIVGPLLDAQGKPRAEFFVSDMLHLNASGYALVTAALAPLIEAWAAAHPERSVRVPEGTVLVDFGAAEQASGGGVGPGPGSGVEHWNNLTAAVGGSSQGRLSNLVTVDGASTQVGWQMTSRFNGANTSGTTAAAPFPASATRDSLFGNTETFGGLANLFPAFRLTGLRAGVPHAVTFYASRTGAGDIRETRYTVTGRTVVTADLDAANNVGAVARVGGVEPDAEGVLSIALAPGPRNNNANHFTYLGVLKLEEEVAGGRVFLVDLGAADATTGPAPGAGGVPGRRWNDVTPAVGTDPLGSVPDLLATDGVATGLGLRMVSRFNAANLDGTTASAVYPASATRDSLYGNTGLFNGLAGVTPEFRLTGLVSGRVYAFGFHASRTGVTDRRETRYVVRGGGRWEVLLEPANNTNRVAWVTGVVADEAGEVRVALEAGSSNTSASQFTYLGVLQLEWRSIGPVPRPTLSVVGVTAGGIRVRLGAGFGRGCRVERSLDLVTWAPVEAGILRPSGEGVEVEVEAGRRVEFLRAVDVL